MPEPEFRGRVGQSRIETVPKSSRLGTEAVDLAHKQLGKPYQWGAAGPDRFDCSGLVYFVFGRLGVALPRVSSDQARFGDSVKRSEIRPGDLLFFTTSGSKINHVGIYIGKNEFIHAPRRYQPVRTESLNNAWWRQRFKVARRMG